MTETEFLRREIATWGEDYVDSLFDRGYTPTLFADGKWRWLLELDKVVQTYKA